MDADDEIFTEVPLTFRTQLFLDSLVRVRRDLYVDPLLATPWSCDPDRCRPLLGTNLCCRVEVRCPELRDDRCAIQATKPFSCALFPLDLVRLGGIRVVTTVLNVDFFDTGWCRYDRDMLRCFEDTDEAALPMFEAQWPVLERVFTQAELALLEKKLRSLSASDPAAASG